MAIGKCTFNTKELEKFRDKIENLSKKQDEISKVIINDIADRTMRLILKKTPVGVYSNHVHFFTNEGVEVEFYTSKVKTGGDLRRGYRKSEPIKVGNNYEIEISNVEKYAEFVENGHRAVNRHGETVGWVKGRFMVKISCDLIESELEHIISKSFTEFLQGELDK